MTVPMRRVLLRPFRVVWRRLTSMRTALILLFLLAVAAVPGSILPQRPLNADKTNAYIAQHGTWGRLLDHLGLYDVFGSVWFAAIYLLLAVSLVGCLIPRIRLHARASVRKPLPAPRNLDRLPESGTFETAATPEQYATAARAALGRRWRVVQRAEPGGAITLSAEKGYSRETGNLLFHVALLAGLVLIAIGQLYKYEGNRIVVQGPDQGFCNTVSQYDTWTPGRLAAEGKVTPAPFCIDALTSFVANYTAGGEPTEFTAKVRYRPTLGAPARDATIRVNEPLRLEGDRVYLISHGFAPRVTVTMPDGTVQHDVQAFVPSDASTLLSEGAFKEQGRPGANQDVGIAGLFAPTPQDTGNGVITSVSPQVNDPVLAIIVYVGNLNFNGLPQSVYSLDTSKMTEVGRANMTVGQTKSFGDGVKVTFGGWVPWVSLQVSHDPTQGWLLVAVVAMVAGLVASLGIRRRRLWLRVRDDLGSGGPTVVEVGGLARSDTGNFSTEFAGLLRRLQDAAGTVRHDAVVGGVPAGKE
ncbi:MAG: cytochrome c biogenesis protein ResB [Jatrophihabitans sp.]|nr:MAG: cytochrome c biogenesis protein ResB [Jatrophihabitans sp.]